MTTINTKKLRSPAVRLTHHVYVRYAWGNLIDFESLEEPVSCRSGWSKTSNSDQKVLEPGRQTDGYNHAPRKPSLKFTEKSGKIWGIYVCQSGLSVPSANRIKIALTLCRRIAVSITRIL